MKRFSLASANSAEPNPAELRRLLRPIVVGAGRLAVGHADNRRAPELGWDLPGWRTAQLTLADLGGPLQLDTYPTKSYLARDLAFGHPDAAPRGCSSVG